MSDPCCHNMAHPGMTCTEFDLIDQRLSHTAATASGLVARVEALERRQVTMKQEYDRGYLAGLSAAQESCREQARRSDRTFHEKRDIFYSISSYAADCCADNIDRLIKGA